MQLEKASRTLARAAKVLVDERSLGGSLFWPSTRRHLHADGSLYPALSEADQKAVIEADWGEYHPLYHPQGVNAIMLYAPRDEDELAVVKQVITASYKYATGRAPQPVGTAR